MKKATKMLANLFVMTFLVVSSSLAQSALFFSEYIEGSSNNKALEIYNPTGEAVSLANYRIAQSSNGGGWAFFNEFKADASIEATGTYVLITDQTSTDLFAAEGADEVLAFPSPIHFNGNDARAIIYISGDDTTLVDVFGDPNSDATWDVAGITGAAANKTLVRKSTVMMGNATVLGSFGTNAALSEWIVKDQDDFSDLGSHTTAEPAASVNVTFRVNTAFVPDTIRTSDIVQIRGGGDGVPAQITWDSSSLQFENQGGDYWSATLAMVPGTTVNFKFAAGFLDESMAFQGYQLYDGGKEWEFGGDNRVFTVPGHVTEDIETPLYYVGSREPNPFFTEDDRTAGNFAVTFRVNVGGLVIREEFDPESDSVGISGGSDLFPADWGTTNGVKFKPIPKVVGDNYIYYGTVFFDSQSEAIGNSVSYKYLAFSDLKSDSWESRGNRSVTIPQSDSTITLEYYDDLLPIAADPVDATVRFGVNAAILESIELDNGNGGTTNFFSTSVGDSLFIRGGVSSAGWGSVKGVNDLAFDQEAVPVAYQKGFNISAIPGDELNYKYYIKYHESRYDATSDNFIVDIPEADRDDFQYEEPATTGGGNRVHVFSDSQTQDGGISYFNDVSPGALITEENTPEGGTTLTFSVDMAPAKSRQTNPFDPSADNVYLVLESKYTALTWGIRSGDGFLTSATAESDLDLVRFTRVGETDVFELAVDLPLPTFNDFGFNIAYGDPIGDAEVVVSGPGGTEPGRRYYEFIQPTSVEWGDFDPFLGRTFKVQWPATHKIDVTWTEETIEFSTAPDYPTITSNEDNAPTSPSEFSLKQNFPNPFNPSTNIQFNIPQSSQVTLEVYNLLGQRVASLLQNQLMPAGSHGVTFDASNLASGMYIYRLKAGNMITQKSMTLIK